MNQSRRQLVRQLAAGLAGTGLAGLPGSAFSQAPANWPNRPVRLIYPYATGGSGDVLLRSLTEGLHKIWNTPVVADNRPGAGGMIGAEVVAKAGPDGHTLLLTISALVLTPQIMDKPAFHPVRDLAAVSSVGRVETVLVVHPSLPVKDC